MRLYDGTSDLDFVYGGLTPASVMRQQAMYRMLFEAPCVLYDTTDGRVVSFEPLSDLAVRMAVPQTTSEETFTACEQAMSGAYKAPGVAEVEEKADAAQTAAQTASETAATARAAADEAKGAVADATSAAQTAAEAAATAQTTADEAKATADTAAVSVNEYMDALLGLSATSETEATDAE